MNVEFISDMYTVDGLRLPMVHFESSEKDICVVFVHGMCGTVIDNYFTTVWADILNKENIGFIYAHNRGHSIENDLLAKDGTYKRYGCMYEIFEECVYDIDLAIEVAKSKGYKRIILAGHSYGCNKVIYYYYKRKPDIIGIILASAPDMVGIHTLIQTKEDMNKLLEEAKENIDRGEPTKLLHKMIEDYMYMSSQSYYNWYNKDSLLNNFPTVFKEDKWEQFESINVPMLTFSGSNEEDYYKQFDLLKEKAKNCPNFKYRIIEGSGHTYKSKEKETGDLIKDWIKVTF